MSDDAPAQKKSLLKLIIIIVAAAAVLGGGGTGTWWYLKKRAAAKAAAAAEKQKAEEAQAQAEAADPAHGGIDSDDCEDLGEVKEGHQAEASPVMVLTRTLNLTGPRRNAFLRCELNILFCDTELGKLVSGEKPSAEKSLIQSIVLGVLSGKSVEEASDAESREALRKEIKDKLNEQFRPHPPKPGEKEDPKHKKPRRPIKSVLIVDWAIQQ
ncbi:MAG TPA: flagellar basal body-associated FliL family protein [Geothrix sp.]|nr:flagellar basal body-associated FliL family protein [Geothrix sp.]